MRAQEDADTVADAVILFLKRVCVWCLSGKDEPGAVLERDLLRLACEHKKTQTPSPMP